MSNIITRPAMLEDLPILLEFEQGIIEYERPMDTTLKRDTINYYDLEGLIKSPTAEVIVALDKNQLIGSGYVKILDAKPYLNHHQYGYIGFMYVVPEHRGRGINKHVNDALIKWTKSHGVNEVRLEVYDENTSAIKAYEKVGYAKNLVEMRMSI